MSDALITGIFTIIGMLIGGLTTFVTAIYAQKKNHSNDVQKVKRDIILKKINNVNEIINRFPNNDNEVSAFRNFIMDEYTKNHNGIDTALEMLYLSEDVQSTFACIDQIANNIEEDTAFEVLKKAIISYRSYLIKVAQDELDIKPSLLQKKKNKKYKNNEAKKYVKDVFRKYYNSH